MNAIDRLLQLGYRHDPQAAKEALDILTRLRAIEQAAQDVLTELQSAKGNDSHITKWGFIYYAKRELAAALKREENNEKSME